MSRSTISTFKLSEPFPDEVSARKYLESRLWPDGVRCPECKKTRASSAAVKESTVLGGVPKKSLRVDTGHDDAPGSAQRQVTQRSVANPGGGTGRAETVAPGARITTRKDGYYRCNACKLDFTVRVGTIFERSHVPLHKWLYAMYLLVTARKGISSMQLAKEIGITQKSAWFVLHRLREALGQDIDKLRGQAELTR